MVVIGGKTVIIAVKNKRQSPAPRLIYVAFPDFEHSYFVQPTRMPGGLAKFAWLQSRARSLCVCFHNVSFGASGTRPPHSWPDANVLYRPQRSPPTSFACRWMNCCRDGVDFFIVLSNGCSKENHR
jgi:hypothetical protein